MVLFAVGFAIYGATAELDTMLLKVIAGLLLLIANGFVTYWTSYMQRKGDNVAKAIQFKE